MNPRAVVETEDVGPDCVIAEFVVVRRGARLGRGVVLHPHVVIESEVELGDGVEVFPGAYLGKVPKGAGTLRRPLSFERRVVVGVHCSIGPHAVIYCGVRIGADSLVGDGASIREQCRIGSHVLVGRHVNVNYAVTIGDRARVLDGAWLAGNMTIGEGAAISGGVLTANDNSIGREDYSEAMRGPDVEAGARVGVGAILLPNLVVGRDSVVAAHSLVTRDVPPGSLVMGSPARVVRETPAE